MVKIQITAGGIFGADGELPIGSELDLEHEPTAWAGRYTVISDGKGDKGGKTPVTNPKVEA